MFLLERIVQRFCIFVGTRYVDESDLPRLLLHRLLSHIPESLSYRIVLSNQREKLSISVDVSKQDGSNVPVFLTFFPLPRDAVYLLPPRSTDIYILNHHEYLYDEIVLDVARRTSCPGYNNLPESSFHTNFGYCVYHAYCA